MAITGLDGAAWDEAFERYETEWKAAYDAEFVRYAVSRGWSQENAESWPSEIHDEAFLVRDEHGYDPIETAREDVRMCELETE
jgi:hypothetical protein